jgi:hypothetical protein
LAAGIRVPNLNTTRAGIYSLVERGLKILTLVELYNFDSCRRGADNRFQI